PSFAPRTAPGFQLCLSAVIPGNPLLDFFLCQSKMICYFLPRCSTLPHSLYCSFQLCDMCVFPLRHTNTPCIGLFSYTGGVLSIVHFYWTCSHFGDELFLLGDELQNYPSTWSCGSKISVVKAPSS